MALANTEQIKELLTRGVENVIELENLKNRLLSGEKLRVKFGVDPTSPNLHLGNSISFLKLRRFQELDHQIVLILGDFTAQIGDPSDKLEKRPFLSKEEIEKNLQTYKIQIGKILDIDKIEWHKNSEWMDKMSLVEFAKLANLMSVQQVLHRRNFKERLKKDEEIMVHELYYPLYQGYDSVAIKADLEIGGNDQLFNLLVGRKIQEAYHQTPQDIMTFQMLDGLDGEKMSKTRKNIVNILDNAKEQFGKIMSIPDNLIIKYFTLCTDISLSEINQLEGKLKAGTNPRDLKAQLAGEIVKLYHGENAAEQAEKEFDKIFREKKVPEEIKTVKINLGGEQKLTDLMFKYQLAPSKGEAARLIDQKAVEINDEVILDRHYRVLFDKPGTKIIKVGKRGFLRLDII